MHCYRRASRHKLTPPRYATGLSHSTIYAVLKYVGLGDDWIDFFKKYLEAPLNLDLASDDRPKLGPRIRKRGVPMAHASEKLVGELVLFFMDLAVNRQTGILLYRLHDDIWLVGEPAQSAEAWTLMQTFAKIFGLDFNRSKTGSVYMHGNAPRDPNIESTLPSGTVTLGFLQLDEGSGKWVIDRRLVQAHVDQLQKQLSNCHSVLSWVQTWNSCIGRFFSHTFGEPAFCFGKEHVDAILDTYSTMLSKLFPNGGSVVTHRKPALPPPPFPTASPPLIPLSVKTTIQTRFSVPPLPDAFLFLPENLGGLALRNPFVPLFLLRDALPDADPSTLLTAALLDERERYAEAKKEFDTLGETALRRRFHSNFPGHSPDSPRDCAISASERKAFMTLDEFCRVRERTSIEFRNVYLKLVSTPEVEEVALSKAVRGALVAAGVGDLGLDAEKRWVLQLYADELLAEFGGLALVDKQFLPVGVLSMMRGKKVSWQMVL